MNHSRNTDTLLYPCLVPVENVSWMLLSEGAKLEPRLGLGGERLLTLVITHRAGYVGVLLYMSKRITARRELRRAVIYPQRVLSRPDCSTSRNTLSDDSGRSYVRAPKIVETLGVVTVESSRASGLCAARDHASGQYPVIWCTLPRAQSRLH
jgi:hypothetical protein